MGIEKSHPQVASARRLIMVILPATVGIVLAVLAAGANGTQQCIMPSTTQVTLCTQATAIITFTPNACATAPFASTECTTQSASQPSPATTQAGPYTQNGNYTISSPPMATTFHYAPTTTSANCPDISVPLAATQVAVKVLTVHVTKLTIVSGATQQDVVGASNWAAVQSSSGHAIAQATIDSNDPDAAAAISWSTGDAVPGQPLERSISLATSSDVKITAQGNCGDQGAAINLWVLWGSVSIQTNGVNPTSAPQFNGIEPGGETLGAVTSADGQYGAGKVCIVGTLTPAGVNSVVTGGWSMPQERISHDLQDGEHASYWDATWTSDGPQAAFAHNVPDASDKIYSIDGPSIGSFGAKVSYQTSNNFRDRILWHGSDSSDYGTWCYLATWTSGANPAISPNNVGGGSCTLY